MIFYSDAGDPGRSQVWGKWRLSRVSLGHFVLSQY